MGFTELRGKSLIAIILLTSGLDFLLFGCEYLSWVVRPKTRDLTLYQDDQGLFGGILGGQRFKDTLGNPNPTMTGLVTAIYDIGCALGAVVAFVYGEKIGRKRSIMLANLIVVIGAAIQTASFEYWFVYISYKDTRSVFADVISTFKGKCLSPASSVASVLGSRRLQCQFSSQKRCLHATVVHF